MDEDIHEILTEYPDNGTMRETLIMARLGQGKYRKDLLAVWGNRCAVTNCNVTQAIRASHAKPWRDSTNEERLNPNNGLPLVANLDALFDAGLISFDRDGNMMVSPTLRGGSGLLDNMPSRLSKAPTHEQAAFFEYHSQEVFRSYISSDGLF